MKIKNISRIILAVLLGAAAGGALNMSIISISGSIIPPPEGAITSTMEGLKDSIHLFEPRHFIMPFLAHALGTLLGAFITALIVTKNKIQFALGIGFFFMLGGIANVIMLPSPFLFAIVDLILAYVPTAYLGGIVAVKLSHNQSI
jgi:hypothetical protein